MNEATSIPSSDCVISENVRHSSDQYNFELFLYFSAIPCGKSNIFFQLQKQIGILHIVLVKYLLLYVI